MAEYPLDTSASGVIAANGTAVIAIGPQLAREQWSVTSTTVTALGMTVTVATYNQVVDSTTQDPRPTATDNTPFTLMSGNRLTITWSNGVPGTSVSVKLLGTRKIGGSNGV